MAKKQFTIGNVKTGLHDEHVIEALDMAAKESYEHQKQHNIREVIKEFFKEGCYISNPQGSHVISSKLILQVLWKTVNKMKIPDFKIYRAGPFDLAIDEDERLRDQVTRDWAEQAVTAGVSTVMKEGDFIQCMRDKNGAFYQSALYGDSHVQVGYDENKSDYPIRFRVSSLSNFYVNSQATDLRSAVDGNAAGCTLEIFKYTMKQFDQLWPNFKGKVTSGEIPIKDGFRKELEKTWQQEIYDDKDTIEVAYYTSIEGVQVVFAGPACTVLRKYKGEMKKDAIITEDDRSFPFNMDGENYLPTLHFKFFPSPEGYANWGLAHMIYDIAVVAARMDNMAYKHAGRNINPINFVNSTNKKTSKLFNDILKAEQMRDAGGDAYVVSENPQGTSGITVESLQSAPITGEWERAFTRLEQQVRRLGFEIDAPDLGSSPNEMSIMSAQENADAPIKQVIEYNASEFEMAVKITMDFIRKFVPDDDMTPLNSTVDIEQQVNGTETTTPMRSIPLGWVAQELRKNRYFVVVNSRDGTIPSNVMELAKARETMSTLAPGSPAWNKMSLKIAQLNGHQLSMEDLGMQAPGPNPEGPTEPAPTETTPLNAVALKKG